MTVQQLMSILSGRHPSDEVKVVNSYGEWVEPRIRSEGEPTTLLISE